MCGTTKPVETVAATNVRTVNEYSDEIRVGQLVRFNYGAGSEEGDRTVRVESIDSDHINGLTVERNNEYRSYLRDRIYSNVEILEDSFPEVPKYGQPTLRVSFADAGERLLSALTGEQLAALYASYVTNGEVTPEKVEFDANNGEVVVTLPVVKPKFDAIQNRSFAIVHNDKRLAVYLHTSFNQIGVDIFNKNGTLDYANNNLTPEEFLEQLKAFMG